MMHIMLGETLRFLVSLRQIRDHGENMLALRREQISIAP